MNNKIKGILIAVGGIIITVGGLYLGLVGIEFIPMEWSLSSNYWMKALAPFTFLLIGCTMIFLMFVGIVVLSLGITTTKNSS